MPKKSKMLVYDGMAEEFRKEFRDGRVVVLKRGIVTKVDDDIFEYLKSCRKKNNLAIVNGIETNYAKKLKERVLKEG